MHKMSKTLKHVYFVLCVNIKREEVGPFLALTWHGGFKSCLILGVSMPAKRFFKVYMVLCINNSYSLFTNSVLHHEMKLGSV